MFETGSSNYQAEFDQYAAKDLDAQVILRQCSSLPEIVRAAVITRSFERILNDDELSRITNPDSLENPVYEEIERLKIRRETLEKYLGDFLICLVIQLPGVRYTIEIDAINQSVVHWEHQILTH